MAGKPEYPVDPLTHSPLLFVPDPNLPPLPAPGEDYDRSVANFHHPVHQRRIVEGFGIGGEAARDSRLQWAWFEQHTEAHRTWGGLTEHMPATPAKQYRTTLFGLMNYVPEQGIRFSRHEGAYVDTLTGREREMLRLGGQLMIGNDGVRVRRFLLDFSVTNGIDGADERLVERFLRQAGRRNKNPEKLIGLGEMLLNQTIDPVVTPGLRELYAYTRRNHMVRPGLPRSLGSLIRTEIVAAFKTPQATVRGLASKFAAVKPELASA
jgi:hypothetical protein